jgi:hypothetical protein
MATKKCGCGDKKQGLPPGVCFPWEEKVKDIGAIVGDESIIKGEWDNLEAFAYVYLWWWVQR